MGINRRTRAVSALLALLWAGSLARASSYPITQATFVAPGGSCTAVACTSADASRYLCRDSTTGTTLYACNTATGFYVSVASGGGGSPGGSNLHCQFNNNGVFGGDAGCTYDPATDTMTIAGNIVLSAGGATVDGVDLNAISDANVSDTLTSSIFRGSGTTTDGIDLATAEVAGTLPVARGGTNATSQTANRMLITNTLGLMITTDPGFAVNATNDTITVAGGVIEITKKIVTVGPGGVTAGYEYADVNAACAAETSTAANPLMILVFPGVYTSKWSCSGQDHLTIMGASGGASILRVTGLTGNNGCFEPGTSTNWTISGIQFDQCHRGIWATGSGGDMLVQNNTFTGELVAGDEDCGFWDQPQANSTLTIIDNLCRVPSDGFTFGLNSKNFKWIYVRNRFESGGNANAGSHVPYNIGEMPCYFYANGDVMNLAHSRAAGLSVIGYYFTGGSVGCATGGQAFISGAQAHLWNQNANGQGGYSRFVRVSGASTDVATLYLNGNTAISRNTDATSGSAGGLIIENATSMAKVTGGYYRSIGFAKLDFQGNVTANQITLVGVDHETVNDVSIEVPGDQRRIRASSRVRFGDAEPESSAAQAAMVSVNSAAGGDGLYIDLKESSAPGPSPVIAQCNATSGAGEDCVSQKVDGNGKWILRDMNGAADLLVIDLPGSAATFNSNHTVSIPGALVGPYNTFGLFANGQTSVNSSTNLFQWHSGGTTYTPAAGFASNVFTAAGGVTMDNQLGIRLREADGGGDNYEELRAPAALGANRTHTLDIVDATCTGDGNAGCLTVDGSGNIVCSADDGGAGAETNSLETVTTGILDDEVPTGSGAGTVVYKAIPDCNTGNMLTYETSTNTWDCEADDTGAGGGDPVLIDGVGVTDGSGVDLQGGAGVDITFNAGASPDTASFVLDATEVTGTTTWGGGAGQVFVWNAGATDPTFTFASDSLVITNVATLTVPNDSWSDAEVSNTLTSSIFVGSGSSTNAIDLATAEVDGTLPIARGGTNLTSYADQCVLTTSAANVLACDAGLTFDDAGDDLVVADSVTASSFVGSGTAAGFIVLSEATANGTSAVTITSQSARTNSCTMTVPDVATTCDMALGDTSGAALTGDSATSFFSAGTIDEARLDANTVLDNEASTWASAGTQVFNDPVNILPDATNGVTVNSSGLLAKAGTGSVQADDVACTGCVGTTDAAGLDISDDTNLTGGAGVALSGDAIVTASSEADFLASGALTCGASTQGKAQVHTTPLQYCDNAGTPTLRYAAYGNSTGESTASAAASVDVSDDTNLTGGRSLTMNGDASDADVELYTRTKDVSIDNPVTGDSGTVQVTFPLAVTITRVWCSTDTGTATIQLDERAEATPNTAGTDVMTSTLVCDNNTEATTSFTNAGIASRVPLNLDIDAVASAPTKVRIHVEYTVDD